MPAPRKTSQHCQAVEDHGKHVRLLIHVINDVREDGFIDPDESRLLDRAMAGALASYDPLPGAAAVIDNGVRIVGAMLNTLSPTEWTIRLIREAATDEARITTVEELALDAA